MASFWDHGTWAEKNWVSIWDHMAWAEKNHGLLFLFLRYSTPDWAEEGGSTCIYGNSKGLWDLNEDIKSLLLNLYNSLNK